MKDIIEIEEKKNNITFVSTVEKKCETSDARKYLYMSAVMVAHNSGSIKLSISTTLSIISIPTNPSALHIVPEIKIRKATSKWQEKMYKYNIKRLA